VAGPGEFEEEVAPIGPPDYASFLIQLRQLLSWVANHPSILSPVRQQELRLSLAELEEIFDEGVSAARSGQGFINHARLEDERLTGANGRLKLDGWRRARDRFYDWMSRRNARRALRWGNPLLDSLSSIMPLLKPVQEIVQVTENLLQDASAAAQKN
jgi:hypothetical protein